MILVAFWQNKPTSQKPYMSRGNFGGVVLLSISILSLAIIVFLGEVVWPGEIPPSWELECVDDDAE
jgi:hypothetical protein